MVRLINSNNVGIISDFAYSVMKCQEVFTHIENFNHPDVQPCVYVMWHQNQFCIHGIPNRSKLGVLISTSLDGEIIARVCTKWGFIVCRGSAGRKGAVSSMLKMIDLIREGNSIAIMVDGPRGPLHKVKGGAITLARETKVPIVPVHWCSHEATFRRLPSWDKMSTPIGPCKILNIFGEPIYVNDKTDEEVAQEIRDSLYGLEKNADKSYEEAKKLKLWNKKR